MGLHNLLCGGVCLKYWHKRSENWYMVSARSDCSALSIWETFSACGHPSFFIYQHKIVPKVMDLCFARKQGAEKINITDITLVGHVAISINANEANNLTFLFICAEQSTA